MSGSNLIIGLQYARTKVKWWTLGASMVALILHFIIELRFVDYSYGTVKEKSPFGLGLVFGTSFLMSFLLGVFAFPRWYALLALATVTYIVFSIGGR